MPVSRGILAIVALIAMIQCVAAQGSAPATLGRSPVAAPSASAAPTRERSPKPAAKKPAIPGFESPKGPITTEVYADEARFDSAKYVGVFSGHVIVRDPRFNLQSDKLTIYINKGQNEGLDKAVAEGNVGVVREGAPSETGGPPNTAVGRADKAVYTAKDGNVELTGSPRVQQGLNSHVAMSPDTVMVLNQSGQLQTRGPSRTEIRQEPKQENANPEAAKSTATPAPTQR